MDFGSIRIKLNNIKSYGIAQGDAWYAKMYRLIPEKYITRKSIFGKVHKKLVRAASTEATDSAYPIDIKERTKSWYSNAYGQWRTRAFTEYYAYNRSTRNYCKLEYTFCLDDNGDIVQTHVPLSNYDLFMQPESYLYVTTFQGENYKWFEHHVEFDIHEKCLELDKYMR